MAPSEQKVLLDLIGKFDQSRRRKLAQTTFLGFVQYVWPGFVEGQHHKIMARAFDRIISGDLKRLIISMPPRHTKALALDTPILTLSGWSTMAAIQPGDMVFGSSGAPVRVVAKSEVFRNRPCFTVTTDDGASVVCDEDHLWTVRLCRKRDVYHPKTAAWLANRQFSMTERRKPMLPQMPVVQFPEAALPIDPYTLGVWLGDGACLQSTISSHDDDQPFVRARIEEAGYVTKDRATRMSFGVDSLKVPLRNLGLLGNKYIPEVYLRASARQRAALLDGLMDTDGNISKTGHCFLATSSKVLSEQYLELLLGLGIKAKVYTTRAIFNGRDYGDTYRIGFYAKDICTIPRKRDRSRGYVKPTGRYIELTEAPAQDVVCIQVDAEDGLFMAGTGLVLTHNSEFSSIHFPAYFLGRYPSKKLILSSHTAELAVGFGRKVRNLINSDIYAEIFPTKISQDSKSAARWSTQVGGEAYALGVGSAMAGRGADVLVIDDPHSEAQGVLGMTNPEIFQMTHEWFTSGPRQRMQPGGAIIVCATRWHSQDLPGWLLDSASKNPKSMQWEYIELPAILPSGKSLWPEFWPVDELLAVKADLPPYKWQAQYQQRPGQDSNIAVLRKDWWRKWEDDDPPELDIVLQAWDTAFSDNKRSDFTACLTFGIFFKKIARKNGKEDEVPNIILLDAWRKRLNFPDLKDAMLEEHKRRRPDIFLVENKGSGTSMIQELRSMGIPVSEFTPHRGLNKMARANAVSDILRSGFVWAPNERWAEEVIEECHQFPFAPNDDMCDAFTMALLRFREGGWAQTENDNAADPDEDEVKKRRRRAYY